MADRVQDSIDKMSSELKIYHLHKILTPEELDSLVYNRKRHEYRVQRKDKLLFDYIRYIKYERDFETVLRRRVLKSSSGLSNSSICSNIIQRITALYRRSLRVFNDNVDLLADFISYVFKRGVVEDNKEFLLECCLLNSKNIEMWMLVARMFLENDDINFVRFTMTRALKIINTETLYKEFFKMELEHIKRTKEQNTKFGLATDPSVYDVCSAIIKEHKNIYKNSDYFKSVIKEQRIEDVPELF